ncbi:hypothetical protein [Streptomyces sp. KMM 9044]|uniref:hypothetical protein n=1 Tax=Streptomyces sp. KMM 9044 TaxID=2744474 RepID=UPI002151D52A|nr:hypothetical protein [Streptomyces sp. KMM 9044]WAX76853.1 hypothetical protein HUV60_003410 [Streptomyces sp. KMM 9044]
MIQALAGALLLFRCRIHPVRCLHAAKDAGAKGSEMGYILGVSFFFCSAAFMSWKARQLWRDPHQVSFFMTTFTFLPFGEEVKRGEVRSIGLTAASLWGIMLLLLTAWVDESSMWNGVIFLLSTCVILLSLTLEMLVILFNQPKFIVPPHMRSELGILANNRTRRKR